MNTSLLRNGDFITMFHFVPEMVVALILDYYGIIFIFAILYLNYLYILLTFINILYFSLFRIIHSVKHICVY